MKIFFPNVVCVSIVDCSEMVSLEVEPYDNYGLPRTFDAITRRHYEHLTHRSLPPSLPVYARSCAHLCLNLRE